MDWVRDLLQATPEIALFVCLALGYLVGKLRVGPIQLGGICGTLIVALVVGLLGVSLNDQVRTIAFALFIFALGFSGGPQFFANLNRSGLKLGVLSLVEAVTVVALVLTLASALDLDVGTATGILAGAATESAVVGTATEAIGKLDLPSQTAAALQGNVATAYTVCYLFGLITIVLFTSGLAPALMKVNLRDSSRALLHKLGGDDADENTTPALPGLVGRAYQVDQAAGRTVAEVERSLPGQATVQRVSRDGSDPTPGPDLVLAAGDVIVVVGERAALVEAENVIGVERTLPENKAALETREVVMTAPEQPLKALRSHGVFLTSLSRSEHRMPLTDSTPVKRGDVLTVVGSPSDVEDATKRIGYAVPRTITTDFVYLGLGVTLGMLIGKLTLHLGSVPLSLGTGGGALLSGLVFGWFRSRHRAVGSFPPAAATLTKDLGLATFIAATGLAAAPQAGPLLKQYGALLPFAGIGMVLIPALLSLYLGRRLLKIEPPILVGAIAGQQCSTPAISAVTGVTGNSVPLIGYTVTYAISSILLPLTGPIVVGLIGG
ncbi:aspartate-alanine antiporter [Actinosynnema sp. NPDC047251]|uniref:Aspartate-alanine antiporter n=1 Tax=Saccharothrix espanaensis (strain ATCC 51144 / DSM 44229 / JCM 9112 / NBRC 15066 / NRRL 15764) TaxID=1179773 RepID=K0K039_SACES|nr:aspartate-alanine antiporter [Saccharothrix espanaensis]CCH30922.1 Aspartate-alanine antiporter [Saccharothrix espanaensis DSM 44229]